MAKTLVKFIRNLALTFCLFIIKVCHVFSFRLLQRYFLAMSAQESRRGLFQSQSQGKKFSSITSKSFMKQSGGKHTNGKSLGVQLEDKSSKLLTNAIQSDSRGTKWAKTHGNEWQAKRRTRPSGVRTTRQIRRNERERGRKARLNAAFQVLRSVVPSNVNSSGGVSERKMTQVEILRLAKNYISNLTELLDKIKEEEKYSLRAFNA